MKNTIITPTKFLESKIEEVRKLKTINDLNLIKTEKIKLQVVNFLDSMVNYLDFCNNVYVYLDDTIKDYVSELDKQYDLLSYAINRYREKDEVSYQVALIKYTLVTEAKLQALNYLSIVKN